MSRVAMIFILPNGQTAVFNYRDEQMPELQGYLKDVWSKIEAHVRARIEEEKTKGEGRISRKHE